MQFENPIDRALRPLRGLFIALAVLSGPVFLFSYGKMIVAMYHAADGWLFAIVAFSHVIFWLGIASLIDNQSEQGRS